MSALWHGLGADSPEGARARRRTAATSAMATFLLMLLATLGLLSILLLVLGVVAAGASIVAAALLARRYGAHLAERCGDAVRRVAILAVFAAAVAARAATKLIRAASSAGVGARKRVRSRIPQARNRWSHARVAASRQLATATTQAQRHAHSATSRLRVSAQGWPTRTALDRQREAVRLNAAAAQQRREGAYVEAAEQHSLALGLFRDLGDRRSEALTLNNLALALDRAGDVAALDLFEEAATILGELGEEQDEGQVIANLALAFRRRGREERSAEVLEIALGKLNPGSQAYRKVEGLRRAS